MNVLLCGGIRAHHEFLYRQGFKVTWFIPRDNHAPEDLTSPAKRVYFHAPDDTVDELFEVAMQLHERHRFEKVFSFHDDSQELAIRVSKAIGSSFPFPMQALTNTRQKPAMRQCLQQAGIASCWHAVAQDEQSLIRLATASGRPKVIFKPVDGAGSKLVMAVNATQYSDAEWVRQHVSHYPVLMEEHMEGKEFSVESFTAHGVHYFAGITEKFIDASSFVETGHVFPAELSDETAQDVKDYVARVLTGLGVDNTAAHTEIMLTPAGPRIIETHTRVGGDSIPLLVRESTGIDLHELSACIQIEPCWQGAPAMFEQSTPKRYCGIRYNLPPSSRRRITSVQGLDDAKAIPGVLAVGLGALKRRGPLRLGLPGRTVAVAAAAALMSLARAGEPANGPVPAGSVSYLFRAYANVQDIEGVLKRHAVTANLRARFDTGLAPGAVGIGLNASVFVGTDIGSSDNAGNMVHVNRDWTRASSRAWAYLGEYGVRLQAGGLSLRYGLQQFSNPFLESQDNRGLPPTFRGLSGQMALDKAWRLEAGYVDSALPRGMAARLPLATTYGNTPVRRLDFAGLAYDGTDGRTASIYAARAHRTPGPSISSPAACRSMTR